MAFNPDKCLKFQALSNDCTIAFEGYNFSKDGEVWNSNSIILNKDETCYVKGTRFPEGVTFVIAGPVKIISGNVMSLVDDGAGEAMSVANIGFRNLFLNQSELMFICEGLLPATSLGESCYHAMFKGCAGLRAVPEGLLPATTLSNKCYCEMFRGCFSLTEIPGNFLPAKNLAEQCYYLMFRDCNGLISLPETLLPATTLVDGCYRYMFWDCVGLHIIPDNLLPATTLANGCYEAMFSGCSGIDRIVANFSAWRTGGTDATKNWLNNVSSTGTFVCHKKLSKEFGASRIPEGWDIEYLPEPKRNATTFLKKVKMGGFK